ncbi:MAG: hypothetical protein EBT63_06645, partial [Proteobacteria bacterium]|nr:hypothetical protein [Pseudomonadota bacterium]
MKNDELIKGLVNFLIPIIFLYGLYFLSDLFIENGFFALVYSVVLIILGLMMFSANSENEFSASIGNLEIISFSCSLISIIYLAVILILKANVMLIIGISRDTNGDFAKKKQGKNPALLNGRG